MYQYSIFLHLKKSNQKFGFQQISIAGINQNFYFCVLFSLKENILDNLYFYIKKNKN